MPWGKGLLALGIGAVLGACAAPEPARRAWVFEGATMGTTYHVKVVGGNLSEARRQSLDQSVRAQLEEVDGLMSTYREDSELSRLNRHADATPFALSEETWEVFRAALELSELSGGAFDVTVGPLVNAWGFGPGSAVAPRLPPEMSDAEVEDLLGTIGFRKLELLDAPRAILKSRPDLFCDLSALAKGYAVDRVAEALEAAGESDFMVEVGGEVRASGTNDRGGAWRIGVERPRLERGAVQRIVALDHMSLATSGDYRNYRELAGERFSHIMDPRTGRPIRHFLASVSVVLPTCTMADAWATTLMVLGPDEGFELASREDLPALFLVRRDDGFREIATPAFGEVLQGTP